MHEIPKPTVDITEYRLFSGQCRHCNEVVRAKKPENVPQGIMGPNLLSYIAVLAGQYHLSIRKIRSLLKEQLAQHSLLVLSAKHKPKSLQCLPLYITQSEIVSKQHRWFMSTKLPTHATVKRACVGAGW